MFYLREGENHDFEVNVHKKKTTKPLINKNNNMTIEVWSAEPRREDC